MPTLDAVLEDFERQWQQDQMPSIEAALATHGTDSLELLVELLHIDLDYRIRRAEQIRVEDYLSRFPQLKSVPDTLAELAFAEFRLRDYGGHSPSREELLTRFPEQKEKLGELLLAHQSTARPQSTKALNCPHCHNQISANADREAQQIQCNSCGHTFTLDADLTASWSRTSLPKLGRFQLVKEVGRGAFGTVYQARDTELDRIVALKIPRNGTFMSDEEAERFLHEARNAARLEHPGIVRVYHADRHEGTPYIVTEFVDGLTLSDRLTAQPFTFDEAAALLAEVAEALHFAHIGGEEIVANDDSPAEKPVGVIHRDLKPSNIMLDALGRPKVMDFGLAKRTVTDVTLTVEGHILGTPAYMSPEQAKGNAHSADARSDVYSLGVILFQLLTGERPYRGNSAAIIHQAVYVEAPQLRTLNRLIPRDLDTIVAKCLEKPRDKRYQTARSLAEDLHRYLRNEPIIARPISRTERAWRWCQRNRLVVRAATVVFGILLTAIVAVTWAWQREAIARKESEHRKAEAMARFLDAREAVDVSLTGFADILSQFPYAQAASRLVLKKAAEDYERFAQEEFALGDLAFEIERGRTWQRLAIVQMRLNEFSVAEGSLAKAKSLFERLAKEHPSDSAVQLGLGQTHLELSRLYEQQHATGIAEEEIEKAESLLSHLATSRGDVAAKHAYAECLHNHGRLLFQRTEYQPAKELVQQAIAQFTSAANLDRNRVDYQLSLASARRLHARIVTALGHHQEGIHELGGVCDDLGRLRGIHGEDTRIEAAAADTRITLADLERQAGDLHTAAFELQEASDGYRRLLAAQPDLPGYQESLAMALMDLGMLLDQLHQPQQVESLMEEAMLLFESLAANYPQADGYTFRLAWAYSVYGELLSNRGRHALAIERLQQSIDWLSMLDVSRVTEHVEQLMITQSHLAQVLHKTGEFDKAEELFTVAAETLEGRVSGLGEADGARSRLLNAAAFVQAAYGAMKFDRGDREEAVEHFRAAIDSWSLALQVPGASPSIAASYAEFLLESPVLELRNPTHAQRLAEVSLAAVPSNMDYAVLKSAAILRQGEAAAAKQLLDDLDAPNHPRRLAYLSLAEADLGASDAAANRFQEFRDLVERHYPGDSRLQRLLAEIDSTLSSQPAKR